MARVHDSIFDNFSEEALEALDFARCQRADGSFYGTSGQCRKGKEAGAKPASPEKADRRAAARADNEARKAASPRTDSRMSLERAKQVQAAFNRRRAGSATGGAMADAKAGEREIARGEKFIGRARTAMKKLAAERGVAQMRLQIGRVNQIDAAMKRLRKKAEQVGGRLDELTGTKGQGKYYVS